jgi:hypothetical protein
MYDFVIMLDLLALILSPIMLGISWWGWVRSPHLHPPKWRTIVFYSGLCAGTGSFTLWWTWVVGGQLHYIPQAWKAYDIVVDIGLCLLMYSIVASIAEKGRNRCLLAMSGVLAVLPWIPIIVR